MTVEKSTQTDRRGTMPYWRVHLAGWCGAHGHEYETHLFPACCSLSGAAHYWSQILPQASTQYAPLDPFIQFPPNHFILCYITYQYLDYPNTSGTEAPPIEAVLQASTQVALIYSNIKYSIVRAVHCGAVHLSMCRIMTLYFCSRTSSPNSIVWALYKYMTFTTVLSLP